MHIKTPLMKSYPMSRALDLDVWLKMDALQPSGSFKLRGMGYKAARVVEQGARKFISSSGGNAGLAVAYAGLQLGIPVTVYVPNSTAADTIDQLELYEAEVVVTGKHWAEAHAEALKALRDADSAYFHPFDDEDVWAGHASMIDEVAEEDVSPDLVVCSVGGGGLLCGIMSGLERNGIGGAQVLGVETRGADAFYQSKLAGRHLALPGITSRASSLGALKVCDQAYAHLSNPEVDVCTVSDAQAQAACDRFLKEHRVKVELACGAALAAVYQNDHSFLSAANNVLVVVCGGVNM
jgi:L-serine/L-threonine ammonia-lyase